MDSKQTIVRLWKFLVLSFKEVNNRIQGTLINKKLGQFLMKSWPLLKYLAALAGSFYIFSTNVLLPRCLKVEWTWWVLQEPLGGGAGWGFLPILLLLLPLWLLLPPLCLPLSSSFFVSFLFPLHPLLSLLQFSLLNLSFTPVPNTEPSFVLNFFFYVLQKIWQWGKHPTL